MQKQRTNTEPVQIPSSTGELGRAIGASAVSKLGATIAALGVNALLARCLAQSEFAFYGVLIAFSAVFVVFLQFGFQTSITKIAATASHTGDLKPLAAGVWGGTCITLILGFASYFVLVALRDLIFPPVENEVVSSGTVALSATYCTSLALCILYAEAIRGLGYVGTASSLTGMGQHGGVVRTSILLLALLIFAGLYALNLAFALEIATFSSVITAAISLIILFRNHALKSDFATSVGDFFRNLAMNFEMMLGQLLQLGASQHATLIVGGAVLSGPPLALLVAAQQIRNLLTAPMTLFNGASPKLLIHAWRNGETDELEQLVRLGSSVSVSLVLMGTPAFLLLGEWIFATIFGPAFEGASWYFALLLPGLLAFAMGGSAGRVMILLGRERAFLVYSAIAAATALPLLIWSGSVFGATGLSIATSAVMIIQNAALILLVRKYFGIWAHAHLNPARYVGLLQNLTQTFVKKLRRK